MEELLKQMEQYAVAYKVPIINQKGKLVLTSVIKEKKPKRVLEIGTAIGYSALLIAQNSDLAIQITSLELDESRATIARDFIRQSPYKDRIEVRYGDAAQLINALTETYDVVFIDAAKGQYPHYFQQVLPLLAQDGIIIADNVLFRGYVESAEKPPRRYKTIVTRLREYIKMATEHPDFLTEIHHDGDGLAVSYHRGKFCEKT